MSGPPTYYYILSHGADSVVRASLNGVPFFRTAGARAPITLTETANHLLVPGENVLTLDLDRVHAAGGFMFRLTRGHDEKVFRCAWPEMWQDLPHALCRLPYAYRGTFRTDDVTFRPLWLDAPAETFGPEGTEGQWHATLALHAAFASRDTGRIADLLRYKAGEYQRAYPGSAELTVEGIQRRYAEVLAEGCEVRPMDRADLRFESHAGGRVAYVTRASGAPAIVVRTPGERHVAQDLWMTRHDGAWRVFR